MCVPQLTMPLFSVMIKNAGKNMLIYMFLYDFLKNYFMSVKIKSQKGNIYEDLDTKCQTVLPRLCQFIFTGLMRGPIFLNPKSSDYFKKYFC